MVGGFGLERGLGLKPHLGVRVWLRAKPASIRYRELKAPAAWVGQPHNAVAHLVKKVPQQWDGLWQKWQGLSEVQRHRQNKHMSLFSHWPQPWQHEAMSLDDDALADKGKHRENTRKCRKI